MQGIAGTHISADGPENVVFLKGVSGVGAAGRLPPDPVPVPDLWDEGPKPVPGGIGRST
jgi:hypothetical protein